MGAVSPPRPLQEDDDRDSFDCGRTSLNSWFRRHAWRNHTGGVSRVTVLTERETDTIVGYISLSSASIERAYLPRKDQRNRPDPVPATLLGQLAVDHRHQGQGHSRSLLQYALKTALLLSKSIGSIGVITHPIDDEIRAFYERWGFVDLPGDPKRAMIVRMKDLEASGFNISSF